MEEGRAEVNEVGLLGLEKERSNKEGKKEANVAITRQREFDLIPPQSIDSILSVFASPLTSPEESRVEIQNCWDLGIVRMIARILAALADSMEIPAAAGQSVLGTIKIAVMPIAKVFTMCFLGLLMASKYVNILTPSGRKLLNGVSPLPTFFAFAKRKKKPKPKPVHAVGLLAFASLLDLFPARTSRHSPQNASVVCFLVSLSLVLV